MTVGISRERLRVLRVIARMNVGGPARQVSVLTRYLDPVRFEQYLLTGSVAHDEADELVLRGVDVPHQRVRGLGRSIRPFDDVSALVRIGEEVRRFRPHIVHTHTAKAGVLGRTASLLAGIPKQRRPALVHTFHGHLLYGYFSPGVTRAVVQVERMLAWRTDRLVAVGSQVRRDLVAAGIGRPNRWVEVPPGIELRSVPSRSCARSVLDLPEGACVVAYVARLTAVKRPDRFIDVAAEVSSRHDDVCFLVAGDGELAEELGARAVEAGIADQVRMLGWTGEVEIVYAAADVVLLTSDNEGMPVSLIEAALAGRPVVTPAVGSAAEVVLDGKTGIVVRHNDAASLGAAVGKLLSDEELRQAMGRAAAEYAKKRFSPARLVADIEGIYSELAQVRGWWR